jgi:hypothetical protein
VSILNLKNEREFVWKLNKRIKTPSVPLQKGGGNKKEAIKKKKKYKIDYKKLGFLIGGMVLLIGMMLFKVLKIIMFQILKI